jgi:hypothetical protein
MIGWKSQEGAEWTINYMYHSKKRMKIKKVIITRDIDNRDKLSYILIEILPIKKWKIKHFVANKT